MSTIGSAGMVSGSLPLPQSAGSSHPGSRSGDTPSIKVAQDFESVFASMLLKEMRKSLEPGTLFGEDSGDVYGGMFDRFIGEQMTKGTGLGLSGMVQESLERMQNAGSHKPAQSVDPVAG